MDKDILFFDTQALIKFQQEIDEPCLISDISLKQLSNIPDKCQIIKHCAKYEKPLIEKGIPITDETRILMDAYWCNNNLFIDEVTFVTSLDREIVEQFFGNGSIISI